MICFQISAPKQQRHRVRMVQYFGLDLNNFIADTLSTILADHMKALHGGCRQTMSGMERYQGLKVVTCNGQMTCDR